MTEAAMSSITESQKSHALTSATPYCSLRPTWHQMAETTLSLNTRRWGMGAILEGSYHSCSPARVFGVRTGGRGRVRFGVEED